MSIHSADRLEPIATSHCDHRNAEPGYRPSPALQRLVRARTVTCAGPGCRRPAARCDLDHTLAYDNGGITCECGIGPGCRRCHRRKQALQWKLEQPSPGKRGSYCPPVHEFDCLSGLVAVIRCRHSASVSGVRVIQSRAPGPRRAGRMPSLIQV